MALELDTNVAIRHPDLGRLVEAVVGADEHDETHWLEWKSTLDLSTKDGCFAVARTILGMANRLPGVAQTVCEGLGYIVVGAQPGTVAGVTSVDPAHLDQVLEPWLGGGSGPRYDPHYIAFRGRTALVVTIEAPKDGDPVYMLRKAFGKARDGEVFVRKHGKTVPANSADLDALHARMRAARPAAAELDVSLVGDVPLSWFDALTVAEAIDSYVVDRQRSMESDAYAVERNRHPDTTPVLGQDAFDGTGVGTAIAEMARRTAELQRLACQATAFEAFGVGGERDMRALEEYLEEVARWGEHAIEDAPAVLMSRYLAAGHGLVAVRVHNPTGRYLPKVELQVRFDWGELACADPDPGDIDFPAAPRPYGKPKPLLNFAPVAVPSLGDLSALSSVPARARSWIEEGSVRIVFDVGDLRQEGTDVSDEHHLLLPTRPPGGVLHGTWKATVPEENGVIRGTLEVQVQDDPVDLRDLLENDPEPIAEED